LHQIGGRESRYGGVRNSNQDWRVWKNALTKRRR
jgi:hypothetical protein